MYKSFCKSLNKTHYQKYCCKYADKKRKKTLQIGAWFSAGIWSVKMFIQTAFQVYNAAGDRLFNVDSSTGYVGVGGVAGHPFGITGTWTAKGSIQHGFTITPRIEAMFLTSLSSS